MTRIKKFKIILGVLVVAILIRIVAPYIILHELNSYLAKFSPVYAIHVGNFDLGVLTFSYRLENLEARYKATDEQFFHVESVRVGISWQELLRLRILTDIDVERGTFTLTKALVAGSKSPDAQIREHAKEATAVLFPVRVAIVRVHDSYFDFADFVRKGSPTEWRLFDIEASVFNITPTPKDPDSTFQISGTMPGSGKLSLNGEYKKLETPVDWKVNTEIHKFKLPAANPVFMQVVPFSFASGELDAYSEIRSQRGEIDGYVKPFLKNVKIFQKNQSFKSLKYFAYEVVGALSNLILRRKDIDRETKTVATRVAFHIRDEKVSVDTGDAVKTAIDNGFGKRESPGIENSLLLK